MNVFLIIPSHRAIYEKLTPPEHPHLGIGYIAAVLEAEGHRVRIIDIDADGLDAEGLSRAVRAGAPDLVGITATTPLIENALAIAKLVKETTAATTVLGGMHATLMPLECAASPWIDVVVVGEGERTIVDLVRCLERRGDLSAIDGLAYRQQGLPVLTGRRASIEDLDTLPFPARHLFQNHTYTFPDALNHPAFPIITSRGCPGNCTFCTAKYMHGRKFRCRSAENVLDEIELLIADYGAREIHIWDDNFITNRARVFQFRDGILRRKIRVPLSFPNGVRADFITADLLEALKECGAYSIGIGVESGNQAILNQIQKGLKLEQIEKAFRLAREAGIETWGFFLIGLPGEDADAIRDTIDFAVRLDPGIAKFHILKPYPKSAVHELLRGQGLIMDENYIHYGIHTRPVHRLPTLSQDDLLTWQRTAYRRFYLRPSKMIKEVLRVKSLNRLKHNFLTGLSLMKQMGPFSS
jgi:radical SAM superfamily enzyme YgiQ (UPF0313 family)